jgi:hypothetical protein
MHATSQSPTNGPQRYSGKVEKPDAIQYFQPRQVVLRVEHQPSLNQEELASLVIKLIQDLGGDQLKTPPDSILTFPTGEGVEFSLVFTEMTDQSAGQKQLVALLKKIYAQLKDEDEESPKTPGPGEVVAREVSPNWLVGSASDQIGLGGPGAWPVEETSLQPGSWPKFTLASPNSLELNLPEEERGTKVHVAILDTAPCLHDLAQTYHEWHERRPGKHPLLESLLKPGGPLHVYPASYADLQRLESYSAMGHRYLMPDHGLFAAGIIHTIALKATLHLIEVLNPYGIGDFRSIALGFLQLLKNPEIGRPLIVNCSFTLNVPLQGHADPDFDQELLTIPVEHTSGPLKAICDLLEKHKISVVAAAGNDAQQNNSNANQSRPQARYPAAFESVQGVGALPRNPTPTPTGFQTATYSNFSDRPEASGLVTLGGEPGAKQGVLGIYISSFPILVEGCWSLLKRALKLDATGRSSNWAGPGYLPPNMRGLTLDRIKYKPNTSGWAWWAGTSFAAPVVSGILAAGGNITRPLHDKTVNNEDVILVTQR